MADQEQVARLWEGVEGWNRWRRENPGVMPELAGADLIGADLTTANLRGANLRGADLRGAVVHEADLRRANLTRANLIEADLIRANLIEADLTGADLTRAYFTRANLSGANLSGANLSGADLNEATLIEIDLSGANLSRANLSGADLSDAYTFATLFADVDLRTVQGIDTIRHAGPSTVGIDTLYRSGGDIPESFLRGCGVPDSMIEYARALVAAERPIDYYSVFISYSSHDQDIAERLYADLQAKGVRCWYAPHDLEIGEPILDGIDQGIRLHDKLLLILSAASVESAWIKQEVHMALARERNECRYVLFPIRIDNTISEQTAGWPALVWNQRHVGDFRQWKDHDAYQEAFGRVLRDLTTKTDPPPATSDR